MRPLGWSVPVASEIMNPTNNETAQPITTRLVEPRDALALMGIYNAEVLKSTVTFDLVPRTLEEQMVWINDHSGSYPALVAVDAQDLVIGFGSLSPYRDRPAYTTTDLRSQRTPAEKSGNFAHEGTNRPRARPRFS
jgi:hypothetical protein